MRCIYCLEDKPDISFTKREHVMPQCYGTFTPDNLILYQTVCDRCNQYFGDNIELYLGRDTIEGVQRYRYGIKPEKEPQHKRMEFRVAEGELKGVIVMPKYSGVPNEVDFRDVIQVGFFKKDKQEYVFFRPEDIPTAKELINQGYEIKGKNIEFRAGNDEEMQLLLRALKKKGMEVKLVDEDASESQLPKKMNKTLVEGTVRIDRVIYRGIAKIAFNYLAYIMEKDFVLLEDFNGVRDFIRKGEGDSKDYFGVNEPPILYHDRIFKKHNIRITNGHLIVIEWRETSLIGKVSIFNLSTYLVKFCRNFKGILRPIRNGHHFDIESKEVSKLMTANLKLI